VEAARKADEIRAPQRLAAPKPQLLQMQRRSEAGAGPLDVLKLRHFTLPARIFLRDDRSAKRVADASSNPPPLPPSAIAAAKRAATPLPEFE
jgi:type VI secretion system protein ImpL